MSTTTSRRILSWDSFVSKPIGLFEQNFHSMIKVSGNEQIALQRTINEGIVKIAVTGADARYCGIYNGIVVTPENSKGELYIILWDNWKGYVIDKGYFSIIENEGTFPQFIREFRDTIKHNIQDTCCY
jgi:hypothetical protein